MRILDLDLDFFVSDIAHFRSDTLRLDSEYYSMATEASVCAFLERQCLLRREAPVRGRIVDHHQEAFYFWRDLISCGELGVPFSVTHIDAHTDLGLGDCGYIYLMGELLNKPPECRTDPVRGSMGINAGNYLSFAVACRWVSEIEFVLHPKYQDDLMPYHLLDYDIESDVIELKACQSSVLQQTDFETSDEALGVVACEPHVPFRRAQSADFRALKPYDFIVVSRSPGFTPAEADETLEVVRSYVHEI